MNVDTKLPGHPIWADKGDELYHQPLGQYTKKLEIGKEWQSYGWVRKVKTSMKKDEILSPTISLPMWKQDFVRKNRKLYKDNKEFIDE